MNWLRDLIFRYRHNKWMKECGDEYEQFLDGETV